MKRKKTIALAILVTLLTGITCTSIWFFYALSRPAGGDTSYKTVVISQGSNLHQVAHQLAGERLIGNARVFKWLAYFHGKQNQIKAGEYELSSGMLTEEILRRLTSGHSILHPVTIPEGYRLLEIADLLASKRLVRRNVFLRLCRDPEVLKKAGVEGDSLEGFLFPETYHFSKDSGEPRILQIMLDTFNAQAMIPDHLQRAKELGLSMYEVVTLASLIEKETGLESERPVISAVFHNRLKKNMLLQTDPTVIYAIKNFDGNLRKKDLSIDSPYNTYKYRGLPPGPIASPGLASIKAALYPEKNDYLYFVSRQDGSHQFSSSLAEHNRAVSKYQLKRVHH